jgi:hypothetical protein
MSSTILTSRGSEERVEEDGAASAAAVAKRLDDLAEASELNKYRHLYDIINHRL